MRKDQTSKGQGMRDLSRINLNVLLHGLFGIVVWDSSIEVLAPVVPMHQYRAGTRVPTRSGKQDCARLGPLIPGTTYQLMGVRAGTRRQFEETKNAVLPGLYAINRDSDKLHCSLLLPHPDGIFSLRRAQETPDGNGFFSGSDAIQIKTHELALVQILVYENVEDFEAIQLSPSVGWKPELNSDETAVNLHVFAEPPYDGGSDPSDFDYLAALFPGLNLALRYSPYVKSDPNGKGIFPSGVVSADEASLGEGCSNQVYSLPHAMKALYSMPSVAKIRHHHPGPLTSHPAHCMALVVQNQSTTLAQSAR
jgi:hypothetical protein